MLCILRARLNLLQLIGIRAQAMSPEELHHKRLALDRLLEQTDSEVRELQVLLRQHSADLVARVERDLTAQVETSVPAVRQHLRVFQAEHPTETGRAFGVLIENFLLQEVETVFRRWRVREDEEIQAQLDILSARFVAQTNTILERFQNAAGMLFEIPIEQVSIVCPLRWKATSTTGSNVFFIRSIRSFSYCLGSSCARLSYEEWERGLAADGYEFRPHPIRLSRTSPIEHDSI
jgi:hypothetical protein